MVVAVRIVGLAEGEAVADHVPRPVRSIELGTVQVIAVEQNGVAGAQIEGERSMQPRPRLDIAVGKRERRPIVLREHRQPVAALNGAERDPGVDGIVGTVHPRISMRTMGRDLAVAPSSGELLEVTALRGREIVRDVKPHIRAALEVVVPGVRKDAGDEPREDGGGRGGHHRVDGVGDARNLARHDPLVDVVEAAPPDVLRRLVSRRGANAVEARIHQRVVQTDLLQSLAQDDDLAAEDPGNEPQFFTDRHHFQERPVCHGCQRWCVGGDAVSRQR